MCLAIPGKVTEITGAETSMPMARVDFGGVAKEVCMAYVPEATVGDYVIVHVGFALSVVDEDEAQQVFAYLRQMGELDDEEGATGRANPETRSPEDPSSTIHRPSPVAEPRT